MSEKNEYDPYADMIAANQEEVLRKHKEAASLLGSVLKRARRTRPVLSVLEAFEAVDKCLAILDALSKFHPMHGESWCGWPETPEPPDCSFWSPEDRRWETLGNKEESQ